MFPKEPEDIIGDIASVLYNSAFAVGCFLGPFVGGFLADKY